MILRFFGPLVVSTCFLTRFDEKQFTKIFIYLLFQVKKERKVEVEVQYTFVKKLRIPVGCDLEILNEIVKSVHVPDQVEFWWVEMAIHVFFL